MAIKPNGTHAKEIAIHFLNLTTDGRYTKAIVARSIGTAKHLLSNGYTKEEVIQVIDYCATVKKVNMYSIGYISHCINDVLKEIQEEKARELKQVEAQAIKKELVSTRMEESYEQESINRNREKAQRNNIQSGFGKKFDFDMLTK